MKNNILSIKPSISMVGTDMIENVLNPNIYNYVYLDAEKKMKMSGYETIRLGEICSKIVDGPFGTQLKVEDYANEGVPVLRVKNINNCMIETSDLVFIDTLKHSILARSEVLPGDVLITKAGRIGSAAVSRFNTANITSHLCLIRPNSRLKSYYLTAFLESTYGKLVAERWSHKSTRPELTKAEVENIKVLAPPLLIQEYIGRKIIKAEELRKKAKRLRESINNITSELFCISLREDVVRKYVYIDSLAIDPERLDANYYSWEHMLAKNLLKEYPLKKLKQLAYITDGDHGTPEFKNEGLPFIRNKNVDEFLIDDSDLVFIDREYEESYLKSSRLQSKDVLVTKIGTIGRSAVFMGNEGNLNANSALVRVYDEEVLSPFYLCVLFNTIVYQIIFNSEAGGAVQSALSLNRLGEIDIPIIDISYQKNIETILKNYIVSMNESKSLIKEAKQDVEDLIEGKFDESKISEGV